MLTPGEPAGIGPDLTVMWAQQRRAVPLVAVADPALLERRAQQLGLPLTITPFAPGASVALAEGTLSVLPVPLPRPATAGRLDPANAPYVLECLAQAVDGCRDDRFAALVTGPIHKGIINEAGVPFTGHTEFLAERTATEHVVMMLATPELRVALATTHLPLRAVADAITSRGLERTLRILHRDLQTRFGRPEPSILVCGLNPHAGEEGHLGREELEVIAPVLDRLRGEGMALEGPLPADTLFTPETLARADAVLAMYHDQGLPVLKHNGFGRAVNITLGLPIIRTSVDHGTALGLAASGRAHTGSLAAAIAMAEQLATRNRRRPDESPDNAGGGIVPRCSGGRSV